MCAQPDPIGTEPARAGIMGAMWWRAAADVVVGVHYGFLAYLIFGGMLAWRWPRTIALHAAATVWAVLIVTTSIPCPLTAAQNDLREHAGLGALHGGFIENYVHGVLYAPSQEALAQSIVATIVAMSWLVLVGRMLVVHRLRAAMCTEHGLSWSG